MHMRGQVIARICRKTHSVERLRPHTFILISPMAIINQLH
jgi:hypothetical protein